MSLELIGLVFAVAKPGVKLLVVILEGVTFDVWLGGGCDGTACVS